VSFEEAQAIPGCAGCHGTRGKGNAAYALADLLSRRGLERPCETLVAWAREAYNLQTTDRDIACSAAALSEGRGAPRRLGDLERRPRLWLGSFADCVSAVSSASREPSHCPAAPRTRGGWPHEPSSKLGADAVSCRGGRGTGHLVTAAVSRSFRHQHALRVLALHVVVGAVLSACAGRHEAGPTTPQAATETRPATETTSSAATATVGETTSVEAQPPHRHAFWSLEKLVRRLAGNPIRVEGRAVRLDAGTLTCSGDGDGRWQAGRRVWAHFSCIQPTFPPGEFAGPDALFHAHATGQASFVITDASFSRY
jgi:hypothetical protein